jgi:class 3 adenylate cyclase
MEMTRSEILDEAKRIITQDRDATYGGPEKSFADIARVWSARLGIEIKPHQVAIMMADLKGVRAWNNPGHLDSWIDGAGYYACGAECATV